MLGLWLCAAPTAAEPSVRVRADSRIEIGVEYEGNELQVRGALRDELAAPIPAAGVSVTLRKPSGELIEQQHVTTGPAGRFLVERQAPAQQVVLQAAFAGNGLYRGVRVERRIDQARSDVRLELQLPDGPHIDLDRTHLPVRVLAESDSGGHDLAMTLQDEAGRVLARGSTDALGRLTWRLPTDALGPPGSGLLRLESPGDATRGEAQTEARVVRFRRANLELKLPDESPEAGSPTPVHGRLFTAAGPRPDQPVGLFLDGEHVTTALTDSGGHFEATLWPAEPGELEVTARAERDAVGAYTEARVTRALQVVAPRSLPWPWLSLALLPAAWLVASRLRQRGRSAGGRSLAPGPPEAGVQVGSRQHRRATEIAVGGRVVHARTRQPLAGAMVRASIEGATRWEMRTDDDGRFEQRDCPAGAMQLSVHARGHIPLTTRLVTPHRGEWSQCEIRLDSLRDQAVRAYRQLVVPRLPSALLFNLWTPREIAATLRPRLGSEIDGLSSRVEKAAFAPQPPALEEVEAIDATARALGARARPEGPLAEPRTHGADEEGATRG